MFGRLFIFFSFVDNLPGKQPPHGAKNAETKERPMPCSLVAFLLAPCERMSDLIFGQLFTALIKVLGTCKRRE